MPVAGVKRKEEGRRRDPGDAPCAALRNVTVVVLGALRAVPVTLRPIYPRYQ